MAQNERRESRVTPAELAHLGEGSVAYLREMGSDELKGKFPGLAGNSRPARGSGHCLPPTASRSSCRTSATARLPAPSRTI